MTGSALWMRAAVLTRFGSLALRRVEVAPPGPGEVRVRIRAAGVCGSDAKAQAGRNPLYPAAPVVLGHESVGVVESVGAGVRSRAAGRLGRRGRPAGPGRDLRSAPPARPVPARALRGDAAAGHDRHGAVLRTRERRTVAFEHRADAVGGFAGRPRMAPEAGHARHRASGLGRVVAVARQHRNDVGPEVGVVVPRLEHDDVDAEGSDLDRQRLAPALEGHFDAA